MKGHWNSNNREYGLTNEREFVVEAMSNPEFQRLLKSIPIDQLGNDVYRHDRMTSRLVNAWDKFVSLVGKLFNFSTTPELNALNYALMLSNEAIVTPPEIDQMFADLVTSEGGKRIVDRHLVPRTKTEVRERKRRMREASSTVGLNVHTMDQLVRRYRTKFDGPDSKKDTDLKDKPMARYYSWWQKK